MEVTIRWPEDLFYGNELAHLYIENVAPGYSNSSSLWNLSLGYKFLNAAAAFNVKVYDLLDQNVETRRIIEDDYIGYTCNLILTRYAMLSFTYKLSNFGGKSNG